MQGMKLLLKLRNCKMGWIILRYIAFFWFMRWFLFLKWYCVLVLCISFGCVLPAVNPNFALWFLIFFNFGNFCLTLEVRFWRKNRLIAFFLRVFRRFDFLFYLRKFIILNICAVGCQDFFFLRLFNLFESCTWIIIFTFFE